MQEEIIHKLAEEAIRQFGKMPYVATNGKYDDKVENNIFWWTNGFFPGMMWQMYHATGEEIFRESAEKNEIQLDEALDKFTGLDHDMGFVWLHTAVANYRVTGKEQSKIRGLKAANLLAGRFNLAGEFIQAWNHQPGWSIIDSMMNIPLLYWASEETGNPRFKQIAQAHADTLLKYFVRPDGSVGHIGEFDPETGEFIQLLGGQGYDSHSAWSRGQAWALYGFALSYHHTKEIRFLEAAKKIANYFIANVSQTDYLTLVDFKAPYETPKYDASAGCCAACGMLELTELVLDDEKNLYQSAAEKIIKATTEHWLDLDPTRDGLVQNSSQSYHNPEESHVSIVYGDYFYIEALLRLEEKNLFLW